MIQIKTAHEIELMRGAGLVVAGALAAVRAEVRPGVTTGELDAVAEDHIRSAGAIPSFLGYRGFTGSICASINEEIVHGIPDRGRALAAGDNISIDCGAILAGWHGDSAITVTVGEPSTEDAALMAVTERSMWAGLARAVVGGRLTDISHAVEEAVLAEEHEYGIVDHYGGHGIGTEMHQDPHVLNYGRAGRGPKLVPGLCLAIEPMVTVGDPTTVELEDGWTVITKDGSRAAHFEHTVAITPEGPWVLTAEDGGVSGLAPFGVTARS
ncbi:type I methionyl aminopeptidase [Modestobacter sp. I12A-02628]|uniref:Methionine aminopeptidase n=1 Tax=Goekera deserti TaxID=2497753 RepID=A0A7K3W8G2_9ACTN|nr:type I methionyl aminopeptidase [Goekera deserti]MPR00201.1 type I methionyl aminopeptidase [Goekera deserti]NDI49375.1 type I methionyl aminopeptidase [Goekera deserti]NEL52751.1 type I methionyl aminopeptidase [Goekera deserti]